MSIVLNYFIQHSALKLALSTQHSALKYKEEGKMKKQQKSILVLVVIMTFIVTALFLPEMISAGSLEPNGAPVSTMKTLDEIYTLVAPLPTGFVLWGDNTRFAFCDEGTPDNDFDDVVLDKETGLMWSRDANKDGAKTWQDAIDYCESLNLGRKTDWRLPAIEELTSLSEPFFSQHSPSLPEGHPFINIKSLYWSSTTSTEYISYAWFVEFRGGSMSIADKNNSTLYVWSVRGWHGDK